ncbi:Sporulation-like domain containing protein [Methylophilaceae bacterium]
MQKDAPNDQELTLKKRARRRLVGAIALVLLMIIVLPMILKDRSVSTPTEEITITLSNQNTPTDAATSDFDSNIVPAEDVPLNSESVVDVPVKQAEQPPEVQVNEAQVALQTEPKVSPKVVLQQTKTESPIVAEKKSTNSPKFYVQIGVFSDEVNVKKLQAKLSDLGYPTQTEKIDTAKGKKIRLRTHLLGERNEAAIALQNIKDAGLTGVVVSQ